MQSMSSDLLLLLAEKKLNFQSIRQVMEKFTLSDRKVIWSTLERQVKRGNLKKTQSEKGIIFSITSTGKADLPKDPIVIPRPDKAWDRRWRMVIFDIPESRRKARDIFSKTTRELGFGRLQNSIYVTPHDSLNKVRKIATELKIVDLIKMMIVDDIGIKDIKQCVEKMWQLNQLNQRYGQFIKETKVKQTKIIENGDVLKFWLLKTRLQYLTILHDDPILPKELLPEYWNGYEAEETWKQLSSILKTY